MTPPAYCPCRSEKRDAPSGLLHLRRRDIIRRTSEGAFRFSDLRVRRRLYDIAMAICFKPLEKLVLLGFSTNTHCLPVRLQYSFTRQ